MSSERVIEIRGLEVMARVGVPEEERAVSQRLLLDLRFAALDQPADLGDDISGTVDYYSVSRRIIALAGDRPRKLIETLADELADHLLSDYPLRWIDLTVRKFILSDAEWVGVSVRREVDGNGRKV
jgi:7,8-dihydroneopterin aldolase/epimerase/oxygenase